MTSPPPRPPSSPRASGPDCLSPTISTTSKPGQESGPKSEITCSTTPASSWTSRDGRDCPPSSPGRQGRVAVVSPDPEANPAVAHRHGTDPGGHDRGVLAEALELLRVITNDRDLAAVLGEQHRPGRDPLASIASYCHPAGTCKMGPATDPAAVVDATGAVHGVGDRYVADASIMPAITRGNINLPTAMIGARVAAGLLELDPADAAKANSVQL